MRHPKNLPPLPSRRSVGTALAVVVVAFVAVVAIAMTAGWRALAALPPVIVALTLLVRAVIGEAESPSASPPPS